MVIGFGHEMNAPRYSWGCGHVPSRWPGAQHVTWVGTDGCYYRPADTFANIFGQTIDQVRAYTDKPALLPETAVGPDAGQFANIQDLFRPGVRDELASAVPASQQGI